MEQKRTQYEAAGIHAIEMELDCAELVVLETAEDGEIRIEAEIRDTDSYEDYVDNGVLHMKYLLKTQQNFFRRGRNEEIKITLWIPKGKTFTNITMEVGAGNADLSAFLVNCDTMELEVGAGSVKMGTASVKNRLDMETGAGNVWISKLEVIELNVECGVGKCEIGLVGKESDYNYDISCGVGKIQINDNCMKQIGGSENRRNVGAVGNVKLECGVGKIELHTGE